ncbi:helix-turn-helix domain-containing protein [Flagellimonas allohymeniacidonis]|uniref:XRE family transcriptional regulator n=1 Tax=Flagellimonas allohymeniacidonis TaxID=2517819 RepID=A0A4Q8QBB8_9FLAO|nr:helix-turn-helix transcriptional regulator [Allomuricauda hymeniacidonis]TAI47635.1 XRE family transcriptional regulator [Allomuricauda hymeniacidonis]
MNRINEVIKEKDISVTKLAKLIGKSRTITSGYCNNARQPSLETLKKIADILEIDIRLLLTPSRNRIDTPIYIKSKGKSYKIIGELHFTDEIK